MAVGETVLWANSGDSHIVEPTNLFKTLPDHIQDAMPRSVKDPSGTFETIYVDGQEWVRDLPTPDPDAPKKQRLNARPVGTNDDDFIERWFRGNAPAERIADLDDEGIWAEVIYPGLGMWAFNIRTPEVARLGCRVMNDHMAEFCSHSPRFVGCASIPMVDVADAVAEVRRCSADGFLIGFLPTRPPLTMPEYNDPIWEPLWDAFAETGMRIGFHIGTEPVPANQRIGVYIRGRGAAVLNYVETTYGGQRAASQLITSGALDRHPTLKVLVSEGGATWGPFLADRMDEGYRQHGAAVEPQLSKLPSAYLYEQVYASFQHDRSAVFANSAMGWQNVMWGSDYPHFEGTFGHTQKTLHELFDDCAPEVSERIRVGAFQELFPSVPAPPPAT